MDEQKESELEKASKDFALAAAAGMTTDDDTEYSGNLAASPEQKPTQVANDRKAASPSGSAKNERVKDTAESVTPQRHVKDTHTEEGIASRLRDRVSPGHKSSPRDRTSELGPIIRSRLRKSSNSHRAFLPTTAQKSKMLKIGEAPSPHDSSDSYSGFKRVNRRRHKMSPSDSPLAAIARKKTISYDEYERLAKQLRGLVEPTPQAALALTQNALARGLEEPTNGSSPTKNVAESSYVPGSMSARHHEEKKTIANGTGYELVRSRNEGAPFAKRARTIDNGPIYFSKGAFRSQLLTREERLHRKPRPSRLLTGLKREDSLARSAYSAAVAEKILLTLNKVQNPLEREAKKPTPSTSLSWAKYHLALVEDRSTPTDEPKDADELPPTLTLPTVTLPLPQLKSSPLVASKPVASTPSMTKTFAFATPAAKSKDFEAGTEDVLTPFFSPPTVSTTPAKSLISAPVQKAAAQALISNIASASTGIYSFTLPVSCEGNSFEQKKTYEDDESGVAYMFSPPPSQREPPKKTTGKRSHQSDGEAPFSFMPSSPKVDSFISSVKTKEVPPTKIASKSTIEPPTPSLTKQATSVGANPLARFMQAEAGSWKCPSCSVTNGPKYSKCPCCETDKPSDATKSSSPVAPSGGVQQTTEGVNPLARFMQSEPGSWKCPGCAVKNGPKYSKCPCCETDKPGDAASASSAEPSKPVAAGKISSEGFSFGAPAANEKPVAEAPASAKISFGFSPADKKADDSVAKPSFSFGFSSQEKKQDDSEPAKPSFSFGVPPSSTSAEKETTAVSPGFSFGAKTNATDTSSKPSFSFGVSSSTSTDTAATTASTGFAFGASSTSGEKRKAEDSPKSQPALVSASTSGFSFGVAPTDSAAAETEPKRKRAALSTSTISKPETTVPAFTFGSAPAVAKEPKPVAPVAAETQPAFSFGASSTAEPTEKKTSFTFGSGDASASKPGFSFGASTTPAAPAALPAAAKDVESKPSFTFGSQVSSKPTEKSDSFSLGAANTSSTSGFGGTSFGSAPAATSTSSSGFSFGVQPKSQTEVKSSSVDTSKKEEAKTFSFGATSTQAPTEKPAFSFGAETAKSSGTSFGAPSFGAAQSAAATPAAPSFTFGSTEPVAAPAATASAPSQPSFTFGSSAPAASASSAAPTSSGFGSAPVSSGFGAPATTTSFGSGAFGASPATSFGATPVTSATTFGTPATTSATTFGTPAATSTSTFGSNTAASTFGSAPSTTFGAPAASGFRSASPSPAFGAPGASFGGTFGSSSQAAPAPATTFGSIAANTSFGSAPSTSFGSTPTTFGAPASGFRSQSPAAFGTPSPAPHTGFGGPSPPPPNAFGAPAAAPSNVFGAPNTAPSAGFGASSTFGAPTPAFGAAPGASSGFGAPSNTGFGASAGAFGAPASANFGAPAAGAFGVPNNGGFGAPSAPVDGGFNIGAAPSANAKGRRILKAKPRSKRQ